MAEKRRAKGEGSLRLRGRVWWAIYQVEGRRVEESTKETSRAKAAGWLRARLEAVRSGGAPLIRSGVVRLEDLRELLRADYRMQARRSPRTMEKATARLLTHLGNLTVAEIRHERLARYVNARLDAGAGAGTVRQEMAALRRMLRLGYRAGAVVTIPPIPIPPEAPPRQGFLERHQLEAILAELPDYFRPALRFAYLSGWRFNSEVRALEWADVDLVRGEINLPATKSKNGEGRLLPVDAHPELLDILQAARDATRAVERETQQICRWVFHVGGRQLTASYNHAWRRACKAAKLPGILVHDLRRSATRNLADAGVSPEVAMLIQGHRTRSMYTRYRIVSADDMRAALGKLAKAAKSETATPVRRIVDR